MNSQTQSSSTPEVSPSLFEPLLTAKEAAALLHIHPMTLRRWARSGTLPCRKVADAWMFRASELSAWVTAGGDDAETAVVDSQRHPSSVN
jgi:excisionase family DNA binding protein